MENSIAIINREESKSIVAAFSKDTRIAFDKACVASKDIAEKGRAFEQDTASDFHRIAIAFHLMTEEKDAMKKANMTQGEIAEKVFHQKASNMSQSKTVAKQFLCISNPPEVTKWYNPASLYDFKDVPPERLDKDVKEGILKPGMSKDERRAYAAKALGNALEDGDKAEVVKTYDGTLTDVDGNTSDFSGLVEDEIAARMNCNVVPDESMLHTFTSGLKRIVKDKKGNDKEKPIKVMVLETPTGNIVTARYYQHLEESKTKTSAIKIDTTKASENELAVLRKYGIVK